MHTQTPMVHLRCISKGAWQIICWWRDWHKNNSLLPFSVHIRAFIVFPMARDNFFYIQIALKVLQRKINKQSISPLLCCLQPCPVLSSRRQTLEVHFMQFVLKLNTQQLHLPSVYARESTSHRGKENIEGFFVQISRKFTSPKGLILTVQWQV